jgi:hypothetical protein
MHSRILTIDTNLASGHLHAPSSLPTEKELPLPHRPREWVGARDVTGAAWYRTAAAQRVAYSLY